MTFQGRPKEINFIAFYQIYFDIAFQIKLDQMCVVFHRKALLNALFCYLDYQYSNN